MKKQEILLEKLERRRKGKGDRRTDCGLGRKGKKRKQNINRIIKEFFFF